jgi:hypothetical protein
LNTLACGRHAIHGRARWYVQKPGFPGN